MAHDPLCPKTLHDEHDHDDYTYYCMDSSVCDAEYPCQCDIIAKVRADQSRKNWFTVKMTALDHQEEYVSNHEFGYAFRENIKQYRKELLGILAESMLEGRTP